MHMLYLKYSVTARRRQKQSQGNAYLFSRSVQVFRKYRRKAFLSRKPLQPHKSKGSMFWPVILIERNVVCRIIYRMSTCYENIMGYLYGVCNKMWTRNADSGPLQISEGQEFKKEFLDNVCYFEEMSMFVVILHKLQKQCFFEQNCDNRLFCIWLNILARKWCGTQFMR